MAQRTKGNKNGPQVAGASSGFTGKQSLRQDLWAQSLLVGVLRINSWQEAG